MPIINQFDDNVIEIISTGYDESITYNDFDERLGHFVRMTVYNESGDRINDYYSNRDMDGNKIFFNQPLSRLNKNISR